MRKLSAGKFKKFIPHLIVLLVILVLPKINLITIGGARNGVRLDDILILLYFVYFVFYVRKHDIKIPKWGRTLIIWMVIFCLFSLISSIVASNAGYVDIILACLYTFRKIEYFILFFMGIAFVKNSGTEKLLIKFLTAILVFHFIYTVLEYLGLTPNISLLVNRPMGDRVFSTFSGPYELAGFGAIMCAIYSTLIIRDHKFIYSIPMLFGIAITILAESRISLIAIVAVIAFQILYYSKHKVILLSIIAVLATIFVSLVMFTKIPALKRFRTIDIESSVKVAQIGWETANIDYYLEYGKIGFETNGALQISKDGSYVIRMTKWTLLTKEMLYHSPIVGIGPSVVGEGMDGNFTRILVENGFVGFIIWLSMIVYMMHMLRKQKTNMGDYAYWILAAMLVSAIFIDVFEASKLMQLVWFVVGFAVTEKSKNNAKEEERLIYEKS